MKNVIRQLLYRFGYRIRRLRPENRFQAIGETLHILKSRGFSPDIVIDGGANEGHWTLVAREFFSASDFFLIEPQPACLVALGKVPGVTVYSVALTAPGVSFVRFVGGGSDGGGTGAHIAQADEAAPAGEQEIECMATTLDQLFGDTLREGMRVFLKLDLEGHELRALQGARCVLSRVEVIFTEINFYDPDKLGRCVFGDLYNYLSAEGFEILDFASLSSRRRDERLRQGDVVFARRGSPLLDDTRWS